ncbi:MAG: hypothetical protein COU07_03005 [Candidatus Harrisonbacteria bacterium CG10_big_fil_rev_8_21_14_0_10_40_38]|uniref:Capsule synthesis protein CapA domain-containing protein n=1 Tax=Candidatus Harrisonbacteria bacterium CG10_big_fil_rev_8_21_14_0_10_40_38 TaxID=1974583 RepID=A0A2H0UTC8_9BACT|nr:MAG: hypothetical protein COU07_03005 [Candidatus Harrisonbacteria bacterium CG10_big_fil_rev_8_21_14_0_10_40_38]
MSSTAIKQEHKHKLRNNKKNQNKKIKTVLGGIFFIFISAGIGIAGRYSITPENKNVEIIKAKIDPIHEVKKKDEDLSILFVGDIMLSRGVDYYIKKFDDINHPFEKISDFTKSASLTFGNFENPVSENGKDVGSKYSFRTNPKYIEGLLGAGFDIVSIANNHIWDWGFDAMSDTISLLEQNGIIPVGAGRTEYEANEPKIINLKNTRIAFLAYTNLYPKSLIAKEDKGGVSNGSLENILFSVREAKSKSDIVVVSFHWGNEYEQTPQDWQTQEAHKIIDAGADLFIGHHPHVIQPVENYHGKWIAYSLGNFIFDQNFSEATRSGLMLKANIKNSKLIDIQTTKIKFTDTFQPYIP